MDDKRKGQTTQGGNKGSSRDNDSLGNRSQMGATSADFDKRRMQTVESNELDSDAGEANTGRENVSGRKGTNAPGEHGFIEDILDQGSVRTAAFDDGNEPRSKESLEHRGKTLGSDDNPKRKSTSSDNDTAGNNSQPSHGGEQNSQSIGSPEE